MLVLRVAVAVACSATASTKNLLRQFCFCFFACKKYADSHVLYSWHSYWKSSLRGVSLQYFCLTLPEQLSSLPSRQLGLTLGQSRVISYLQWPEVQSGYRRVLGELQNLLRGHHRMGLAHLQELKILYYDSFLLVTLGTCLL